MLKETMYKELRDAMEIYERNILGIAWNTPKDDIEESVLCEFLRNEKNKENKNSPYTELEQIFQECMYGDKDRKYFFEMAEQICKNRKNSIAKDVKDLVKKIVAEEVCADGLSENEMKLLKDALQTGILIAQAKAFLYDAGYPVENKKNTDKDKLVVNGIKRRQDVILELAERYLIKKGNNAFANGSAAELGSKQFKEQSLKLFDSIQREKCNKIFLPLYIDRNTGAGIYILGVKCLSEDVLVEGARRCVEAERRCVEAERKCAEAKRKCAEAKRKCAEDKRKCAEAKRKNWNKFNCHFTYIRWEEIIIGGYMKNSISLYVQACGNDLDEAIDFFEYEQEQSYEVFSDVNEELIDGVEDKYRVYFDNDCVTPKDVKDYREKRKQDLARGIF